MWFNMQYSSSHAQYLKFYTVCDRLILHFLLLGSSEEIIGMHINSHHLYLLSSFQFGDRYYQRCRTLLIYKEGSVLVCTRTGYTLWLKVHFKFSFAMMNVYIIIKTRNKRYKHFRCSSHINVDQTFLFEMAYFWMFGNVSLSFSLVKGCS